MCMLALKGLLGGRSKLKGAKTPVMHGNVVHM